MKLSLDEQHKIVMQCREWLKEAQEAKDEVAGPDNTTWDGLESYYSYGSPTPKQTQWWMADVKCNLLASRVERIVGLYVGERPRVAYEPQEPDDALLAGIIHDVCESDWENGGYDRELRAVAYDMAILGTGFWKTWYDPIKRRICVARVDPRKMVIDPQGDSAMSRCRFVGECSLMPLSQVMRLYPKAFESSAKGDALTIPITAGDIYRVGTPMPAMPRPGMDSLMDMTGGNYPKGGVKRSPLAGANVEVAEMWVREIGQLAWAVGEEAIKNIAPDMKRTYVVTVAGSRVCDIKPAPVKTQGWHPFDVFRAGLRSKSFYGAGDVEGMTKTQDGIDVLLSRTVQFMQLIVNPNFIADTMTQGELPSRWNLQPGGIQFCQGGANSIQALKMPELPGAVIGVINQLTSMLDDRSGVNESVQGRRQAGVESGKHEQVLQEQFARRNKPRLDDRNESLKHWAIRYTDLALESYSKKDIQRRLGKDRADDWDELVREKKGEFDVRIQVGGAIDADPETTMNFIMQLQQNGLLGDPNDPKIRMIVLESVRKVWPGVDALIALAKKQEKAAMDAEAKALTGAPPPSGGPGVPPPPPTPQPAPAPQPAMAGV